MKRRIRISLAGKCQLLFGAAVLLILAAALSVVWLRMQTLVERGPQNRARDLAEAWLTDQIQLGGMLTPAERHLREMPADADIAVALIEGDDLEAFASDDRFLQAAVERFQLRTTSIDWFAEATDSHGRVYYRYARAVRKSDLSRIEGGLAAGLQAGLDTTALADPLEKVLLIHLRDRDAQAQLIVNYMYLVAAGLFAGLLAIGAFWFITMRLVLSPVRLLRDVAGKVSDGDVDIRSDINTGDEFEELSDAFNNMLIAQKEKREQLKSINKSLDLKLDELAESNVALYEANKMKGEFLANVSHELRTPLNSMIGFAEVLQETLEDDGSAITEKRKRYISNIIIASRRLLDLINDLLDLAKIEAGRMDLNMGPVVLGDTCEGLVNLIRPQAEKRNISLKLKIEPNLPIVQTDAGKLQQILFNFLSNAVKFTPAGGVVTMAASLIPSEKKGSLPRVRLSVSDTGPGIAAEDHDRIFDKFTQLDPSVTREHGGTGLGLTISRDLAELLGGRIEVESDRGRGATFTLVIATAIEQRNVPLMPEVTEQDSTATSGT